MSIEHFDIMYSINSQSLVYNAVDAVKTNTVIMSGLHKHVNRTRFN